VDEYLGNGAESRQNGWSGSIAVGSKSFVEEVKERDTIRVFILRRVRSKLDSIHEWWKSEIIKSWFVVHYGKEGGVLTPQR
jgi:hypothetical protein